MEEKDQNPIERIASKYEDCTNHTQISIFLTTRDTFILNIVKSLCKNKRIVKLSKNFQ